MRRRPCDWFHPLAQMLFSNEHAAALLKLNLVLLQNEFTDRMSSIPIQPGRNGLSAETFTLLQITRGARGSHDHATWTNGGRATSK